MKDVITNMNEHKKYNVGYFGISFLVLFIASFLILFVIEKEVRSAQFDELKISEERLVRLEGDFLAKEFSMILSDLHYLHYAFKIPLTSATNYENVAIDWAIFSTQRNIYDQIRFIDANGDEQIRVNLGQSGAYVVPSSDLQNKKDSYYFYETVKLEEDGVYVSPMDLNIEHGAIEEPYKPMIRFSTPLYDENGELQGVVLLNYLAENVLQSFRDLALKSQGEIVLLNSQGYWLSSADKSLEWGFMFDNRKDVTFAKEYGDDWTVLRGNAQITTPKGLFTSTQVNLQHKIANKAVLDQDIVLGDGYWYVVSSVLRRGEHQSLFIDDSFGLIKDVLKKNVLYFSLAVLLSVIVAFLIYLNRKTYSRIKYHSEYDALTQVYNRRAGIVKLNQLLPTYGRFSLISFCFIDVNGLKQVNDTFGHEMGDELLVTVVNTIKSAIRECDFVIRLGGDEFLIVFDGVDFDGAEKIWNRIITTYEEITLTEGRPYLISVSHGIVSRNNTQRTQLDELIKTADERMYEEKRVMKENLVVIRS